MAKAVPKQKNQAIPELHVSPIVKTSKSIFQQRRGLQHMSPIPLRRGKPLSSQAYIGNGIIPHPTVATDRVYVDKDIHLFYEDLYKTDPIVSAATDDLTVFTWQSGYNVKFDEQEEVVERTRKWMRRSWYDLVFEDATRWAYLSGNGYIWLDFRQKTGKRGRPRLNRRSLITDMKVLHPAYMFVRIDEHNKILGYVQQLSLFQEGWAFFSPEEIIHLTYKRLPDRVYGISIAECILRDLHYLRYSEHTIAEVFHDYIAPLLHVMCGYDNAPGGGQRPAGDEALETVKNYFEQLAPNEDLITDNTVKVNPINTGRAVGDYDPALKHFRFNAFSGTKLPHWFFGQTDRITEASAIVMKEIVEKIVSPMQKQITLLTEHKIFPYMMVGLLKNFIMDENKKERKKNSEMPLIDEKVLDQVITADMFLDVPLMVWNPVESFQQKADRLLKELNSGGMSMNMYMDEMGRPRYEHPLADLPIPLIQYETTLLSLQMKQAIIQQRPSGETTADDRKKKGQRTPAKKKPNTDTVDETGQPKAKTTKTHPKGKIKDRKVR